MTHSALIPELDASAQKFNIRMTEGDPLNFQWMVLGAADWADDYVFRVETSDSIAEVNCIATADGDDALFIVQSEPIPELDTTKSGWQWEIQAVDGPTRFAGVLIVEDRVGPSV